MKLCVIGMHKYFPKLYLDELNSKTWYSLSPFFKEIHIIALSRDYRPYSSCERNIFLHLAPNFKSKLINLISFCVYSFIVGLRLAKQRDVIIDASEPIGGGLVSFLLKFLTRKKAIVELQGEVFRRDVYGLFTLLVSRFVAFHADVIRAVSKTVVKEAITIGIPKEKIIYVSQRVDTSQFSPSIDEKCAKRLIGLSDEDQAVIFIGSLVPVKGLPYLIQSFSYVFKEMPSAKLLIIGDGPLKDKLVHMAREMGISQSVLFYGRIPHSKIPIFLASSKMLVLPSTSEGMPRVILEAMACGKPVIASNVGGIRELIIHEKNGLLIPPGDVKGLAENILKLLQNCELAKALGMNARKFVEQNFSYEQGIKMMLKLYKQTKL